MTTPVNPAAEGPVQVVSLVTGETVSHGRVLARSLARHHPDWELTLCLVGTGSEPDLIGLGPMLGLDPEYVLSTFTPAEAVTVLAPRLVLATSARRRGPVLHLPACGWVRGDLRGLVAAIRRRGVMLVPQALTPPPRDGLEPSPAALAAAGRVATDLFGTDGASRSNAVLERWISRLDRIVGAPDGSSRGHLRDERRWALRSLELACVDPTVTCVEDPGVNLGAWSLHERSLALESGAVVVESAGRRSPLSLMVLTGFDAAYPHRLGPHASRARVSRSQLLQSLVREYADELASVARPDRSRHVDIGRRLANGLLFDEPLAALYATALALGSAPEDPFSHAGGEAFARWLRAGGVRGAAHGISRYLYQRVMQERSDVALAFPDLDGDDGPRLAAWLVRPEALSPPIPAPLAPQRAPAPPEPVDRLAPRVAPAPGTGIGVRLSGFLDEISGLGAAARGYAHALATAGVPVGTRVVDLGHQRPGTLADYGRVAFSAQAGERPEFDLIAVNLDELTNLVDASAPDYFGARRIGLWGWETTRIPTEQSRAATLLDEIWVYSTYVAEIIAAQARVPVLTLPPPVEAPASRPAPDRLGVPEGFLFLFALDYSSTVQRKNPSGVIEAFRRAFAPGEGPRLLIKTLNGPLLPLAEEAVLWAAGDRPDIHVIDRSLTAARYDALLAACDCYVSLHRAEGFGLTLAEAMAIGKPVISTAYSGNLDFMNAGNSYLVDYELTRVGPDCPIYPADGMWAAPSVEHAARLMRVVYENPREATRIGAIAERDIAASLSPAVTGAAMRRRLQSLTSPATPPNPAPGLLPSEP